MLVACVEEKERLEHEEPFAVQEIAYESRSDAALAPTPSEVWGLDHAMASVVVASKHPLIESD